MAEDHRVPWFPAWGIQFPEPLVDAQNVISTFNEWRPNERWLLLAYPAAASEIHLWTVWHALRRNELRNSMVGNNVDTELNKGEYPRRKFGAKVLEPFNL